jgi:hypothetical protein
MLPMQAWVLLLLVKRNDLEGEERLGVAQWALHNRSSKPWYNLRTERVRRKIDSILGVGNFPSFSRIGAIAFRYNFRNNPVRQVFV